MENRLRENPLVADAAVLALEHGRQFLAALIVPSAAGHERFATLTKHECNQLLRDWLHQWFEATVLPRKWRFVDALPLNTQGKRDRLAMEALFAAPKPPALPAGVNEPEILSVEQSEGRLVLGLRFSSDCLWFQGHFPGFPILPAVAQIDWLMTCAQRYLGVKADMCRMPRLKFLQPVRPDKPVFLEIDWAPAAHQLNFRYVSQGTGDVLSVGKIYLEQST